MQSDWPVSALARLAAMLDTCEARWIVGGSTGLVLRGATLERAPQDLDIYVDNDEVPLIHERLATFALDGPADNRTERYHSTLSHYRILGTMVELVGSFRISALHSLYTTEVNEVLIPGCDNIRIEGFMIPLVPLGHELIFNLLRERRDRALIVGQLMMQDTGKHLPKLQELIHRNRISPEVVADAMQLLNTGSQPT